MNGHQFQTTVQQSSQHREDKESSKHIPSNTPEICGRTNAMMGRVQGLCPLCPPDDAGVLGTRGKTHAHGERVLITRSAISCRPLHPIASTERCLLPSPPDMAWRAKWNFLPLQETCEVDTFPRISHRENHPIFTVKSIPVDMKLRLGPLISRGQP